MICGSNATTRRTTRKTRRMVKKWRGQSRGETGRSKGGRAVDERGRFLSFAHGIRQLTRSRQHCFQLVRHESSSELRKRKKKKKTYTHTHSLTTHLLTYIHTHTHNTYSFSFLFFTSSPIHTSAHTSGLSLPKSIPPREQLILRTRGF